MTIKTNLYRILLTTLVILISSTMAAADESSTGTLTVVISDFLNSEGYAAEKQIIISF